MFIFSILTSCCSNFFFVGNFFHVSGHISQFDVLKFNLMPDACFLELMTNFLLSIICFFNFFFEKLHLLLSIILCICCFVYCRFCIAGSRIRHILYVRNYFVGQLFCRPAFGLMYICNFLGPIVSVI